MDFNEAARFYFLISNLGETRSGIENSALLRASLFREQLGIAPVIVTAAYNPRFNRQRKELQKNGLLHADCSIINMYEFFQGTAAIDQQLRDENWCKNDGWICGPGDNPHDIRVFDENNNLIMYRKCDKDGSLMFINFFVNKKKIRRDYYDSNGCLSKTQLLKYETEQTYAEVYYRIDGSVCMYKYYELQEDKSKLLGINLTDDKGKITDTFKTEAELISHWLDRVLGTQGRNFVVIDREQLYYQALLKIRRPNISVVCMIHNAHVLQSQDMIHGKLSSFYKDILEDISIPDAVVVLTERQKTHLEERFGVHENLYCIPHAIKESKRVDFSSRTPRRAICLARYSEEKQHESLVRVFQKVIQAHPDAKLDLYGYGELKGKIIKQVKEAGLSQSISVNDFSENTEEIYNNASLAVLASKVEGFALFILESISHGCPAVSYDVNYGPSDMIQQDINGYIVEMNNEEEMARRIIDLFNDIARLEAMSDAAYMRAEAFRPEAVADRWRELISGILENE